MNDSHLILGVDIGGTSIKAAVVDTRKGTLATAVIRTKTPRPATPKGVVAAIGELAKRLKWHGPVGVGFPGLIKHGVVRRAPNLDASWVRRALNSSCGCACATGTLRRARQRGRPRRCRRHCPSWQGMRHLRELLTSLATTPAADGARLLDQTVVLYGSNLGDANVHNCTNLPLLLAGGGFKHGQHLAFDSVQNKPLCNLFVTMLHGMGVETDTFGSSTGTLAGLGKI